MEEEVAAAEAVPPLEQPDIVSLVLPLVVESKRPPVGLFDNTDAVDEAAHSDALLALSRARRVSTVWRAVADEPARWRALLCEHFRLTLRLSDAAAERELARCVFADRVLGKRGPQTWQQLCRRYVRQQRAPVVVIDDGDGYNKFGLHDAVSSCHSPMPFSPAVYPHQWPTFTTTSFARTWRPSRSAGRHTLPLLHSASDHTIHSPTAPTGQG